MDKRWTNLKKLVVAMGFMATSMATLGGDNAQPNPYQNPVPIDDSLEEMAYVPKLPQTYYMDKDTPNEKVIEILEDVHEQAKAIAPEEEKDFELFHKLSSDERVVYEEFKKAWKSAYDAGEMDEAMPFSKDFVEKTLNEYQGYFTDGTFGSMGGSCTYGVIKKIWIDVDADADIWAICSAHEVGHALGLHEEGLAVLLASKMTGLRNHADGSFNYEGMASLYNELCKMTGEETFWKEAFKGYESVGRLFDKNVSVISWDDIDKTLMTFNYIDADLNYRQNEFTEWAYKNGYLENENNICIKITPEVQAQLLQSVLNGTMPEGNFGIGLEGYKKLAFAGVQAIFADPTGQALETNRELREAASFFKMCNHFMRSQHPLEIVKNDIERAAYNAQRAIDMLPLWQKIIGLGAVAGALGYGQKKVRTALKNVKNNKKNTKQLKSILLKKYL